MAIQNLFGDLTLDTTVRYLKGIISKFTFDSQGQLRTTVTGTVGISTNQTVATVSTANISVGDTGKSATAQMASQQNFMIGNRRNFT